MRHDEGGRPKKSNELPFSAAHNTVKPISRKDSGSLDKSVPILEPEEIKERVEERERRGENRLHNIGENISKSAHLCFRFFFFGWQHRNCLAIELITKQGLLGLLA